MLSFAVGGLLGDVFLHILPEAWSFVDRSRPMSTVEDSYLLLGLWVVCGLMTFVALEIMFNAGSKEAEVRLVSGYGCLFSCN